MSSNIINALLPFILLPVLTRNLTHEQYGLIAMFQAMVFAFDSFMGLSSHEYATRKYYDNHKADISINNSCLFIYFFSFIFLLLIGGVFHNWIYDLTGLGFKYILLGILTSACSFIIKFKLAQWQIREKAVYFGLFQISRTLINFILSLLLVIFVAMGADGRIYGIFISSLVIFIFAICFLIKDKEIDLNFSRQFKYKEVLSYCLPLIPHSMFAYILSNLDRFMIKSEFGLDNVAIYMVAVQLSMVVSIILQSLNNALSPVLYKELSIANPLSSKKIVNYSYMFSIGIVFISLMSFIIGPWLTPIVGGSKYVESGKFIGWLCLAHALGGVHLLFLNHLYFLKKTKEISFITITSGIFGILFLLIFIHYFGILGAAISAPVTMMTKVILTFYIVKKHSPLPW